jgi:hypothetical protein
MEGHGGESSGSERKEKFMDSIRFLIGDAAWEDLPSRAQAAITEADFKSRASDYLKSIKPKALSILSAGKRLNLRGFCEKEANRLLRAKKISPEEAGRFQDYFLEQVTGTASGKKDKDGLRLYLCAGDRTYVTREKADVKNWTDYALELRDDKKGASNRLKIWAERQEQKFGHLPPEIRAALDSSDAGCT